MIVAVLLSAALATTTVTAPSFKAVLPGAWQVRSTHDALLYTREDDELYISIVNLTSAEEKERRDLTAFRIVDMRRKLVGDLSRGRATVTPITKEGDGPRKVMWFSGEDPQNGKRFYVSAVCLSDAIIVTALYRPLTAPPAGFEELARDIVRSVQEPR